MSIGIQSLEARHLPRTLQQLTNVAVRCGSRYTSPMRTSFTTSWPPTTPISSVRFPTTLLICLYTAYGMSHPIIRITLDGFALPACSKIATIVPFAPSQHRHIPRGSSHPHASVRPYNSILLFVLMPFPAACQCVISLPISSIHYPGLRSRAFPSACRRRSGRFAGELEPSFGFRCGDGLRVGPQLTSHVFGLLKARNIEGLSEGDRWLSSNEGTEWVIRTVDKIYDVARGDGQSIETKL